MGRTGMAVRRRIGRAALALCLSGLAGVVQAGPTADEEARYDALAREHVAAKAEALSHAGPGYVLVLGDSNAERAPDAALSCAGAVVNAGIGGVRAGQYLGYLADLRPPAGGAAAVINVGTGDAWRGRDPLAPESVTAYERAIEGLVALVRPSVARVVVNALPPLSGRPAVKLDPEAVEAYSERLRELCPRIGCTYADPWAPIRGERFGLARPGTVPDGLHPADPGAAYAAIAPLACGTGHREARVR